MKKYYLDNQKPEEVVNEITKTVINIKVSENDQVYFVHYRPEKESERDTVRIDKNDSRVVFSATGKHFRELLKDKVVAK